MNEFSEYNLESHERVYPDGKIVKYSANTKWWKLTDPYIEDRKSL